jgi:hypothetical protein
LSHFLCRLRVTAPAFTLIVAHLVVSNLTWQECFNRSFVRRVKFHHALQIALSPLALFEHVVLTANPLVEHLTAPSDFEPLGSSPFRL